MAAATTDKEANILNTEETQAAVLEGLGYHQELKRSFGPLGIIGFSFSIVTCWTALGGTLIIGVESGGPPVMIWSWIGICVVSLAVAYSMAEMCAAYPVAGGQYSWVAAVAPPRIARGLSWICGWFMLIGILGMGAVNNFIGSEFILGLSNLSHPDPSHMIEEIKDATHQAPRAIILSVYLGAITGLVFLIAASFCIGDIAATADSSTGVPLIEIFINSTGSVVGSCILGSLITVIVLVASNSLLAEGSRSVYAFARDHGLPFSSLFSRVEKKRQIPVYAICLTVIVQMAFNSIYFGTTTGFETIISLATFGFFLSYAIPLLARILSYMTGHFKVIPGPYSLGFWGLPLNIVGFLYLVFTSITFNFPTVYPVDRENMNYTCAAVGIIMLISAVTWVVDGRKNFTGPETGEVTEIVHGEEVVVKRERGLPEHGELEGKTTDGKGVVG
ncbi:MAG: hypothetical protein M1834_004668 [Cirrosporium novae-zelandiae]|nr:MAG: hypothetical protein M1834_004668 [Cirrosporium novae-zelandiae]